VVNDILITQAGVGTDQIGRFDITVDDDTNSIAKWSWQLIPVDDDLAEPDGELQKFIDSFKEVVDRKYNTIISRLARELTHPRREEETALGNLFADILRDRAEVDVLFIGSGSIRKERMGPPVTLGNLYEIFPYDDALVKFTVTGAQLRNVFAHIMRPENRDGEGECFQVNRPVQAIYSDGRHALESLSLNAIPVVDDAQYTTAMQAFHFSSSDTNLGITNAELTALAGSRVVTTSVRDVLEEYLRSHQSLSNQVEGRLVYR
jgi:5'-nucleotidase